MSARRAERLFALHTSIGVLALGLVLGAGVLAVAGADVGVPSAGELAAACDRWLSDGGPLAAFALAILVLGSLSLLLGLRSVVRQARATYRYLTIAEPGEEMEMAGERCVIVASRSVEAFCAGYVRPRIHLSRGAIERLSERELRAVIAHERHHRLRRDPLRLLLARALADAIFFIPSLRRTSERYAALGEIAADEVAVARQGEGALACALLKFERPRAGFAPVVAIAPERVDHLLGDPQAGHWRLPQSFASRLSISFVALSALLIVSWQVGPSAELPLLLATACMVAMIAAPLSLALVVFVLSRRALRGRRA